VVGWAAGCPTSSEAAEEQEQKVILKIRQLLQQPVPPATI